MAQINLKSVSVSFPVYNVNARSIKKHFLRVATGGTVVENEKHVIINALNDITLSLQHGDQVALLGHNGAGKSTFLRLLATIYEPTRGSIDIEGSISATLNLMSGIETELTGYENIVLHGTILGLTRDEITQKTNEIAEASGLGDYLAMPVRTYSSGMMVRLAFAISTSVKPDILLIDEVFANGDEDFMNIMSHKMQDLIGRSSIMVMASHFDHLLKAFCNKGLFLEQGQVKFFGPLDEALEIYHAARKNHS
jgi:ABC-type polysaccharide/polyol phosphate transport system ATPase subunit